MNDMPGELGDLPVQPRRRGRAKQRVAQLKRKGRLRKVETVAVRDPDLEAQLEKPQKGRNAYGVEGRENSYRGYIAELNAHHRMLGQLRSKWGVRVKSFKELGVRVEMVNAVRRELQKTRDQNIDDHNLMNQMRRLYGLPGFEALPDESKFESETKQNEKARLEGVMCCYRGGLEKDCPYGMDTSRGQVWISAYRTEEDKLRAIVPPAVMRTLASRPAAE